MTDPEKHPCNYQWVFKSPDLNITANVKFSSIQDRDRLLSDDFGDSPVDIPKLNFFDPQPFYDAIEKNVEFSARNYLLATKERHTRLTKEIHSNESELRNIKISIEKSSILTIPTPVIPVNSGSSTLDEKTRMDASFAQAVENKLNAVGDKLAETFECSFGFACASDLDKAAKNPNLGKELSNSDKVELGGTGSGTPDGWGPEDEAHARTHQIPSKEELKLGASEINRNGLTNAGRSLQKHGGREGSVYSYSNQKASVLNQETRAIIDEILDNPNVTIKSRTVYENRQRIEVIDAKSPDGRTLRFSRDGKKFIGFREP